MAELFAFELIAADAGNVRARATPSRLHYNPFDVAQGGFAGTVLDIALGLVSISVLEGDESGVGTVDISATYTRVITESTGQMSVHASILHRGRTIVVAEATLTDSSGRLYARARSTSLISR
ncbi:MAG TPA: PaaI family thioesterase [Candidatus Tumulicola sp.]